jgi:glycerol-3-phosphate O-acyltransferase / dihydroxyacetone phosphate acyltransferase
VTWTYRLLRLFLSGALRLFFRFESVVDAHQSLALPGPVIFVANHPNGLIDPAVVLMLVDRHITFLAKSTLFELPVLGLLLKALGALPVFRRQDAGADVSQNQAALKAAASALTQGRALMLFPEGKSHSEPQLAPLKTGFARIALDAVTAEQPIQLVPIGLAYEAKSQFRSRVHVEVGKALTVVATPEALTERMRTLTTEVEAAIKDLTLNLSTWEDLPLVQCAASLYEFQNDQSPLRRQAVERAFAQGIAKVRAQLPADFDSLQERILNFRGRLELLSLSPGDLVTTVRRRTVFFFVLRNVLWLLGTPFVALGLLLFGLPYWVPWLLSRKAEEDVQSTVKLLVSIVWAPLVWATYVLLAGWLFGLTSALLALFLLPAIALFSLVFIERRRAAWNNAATFLTLTSHQALRKRLLDEGHSLAAEIHQLAQKLS